MAYSNYRGEGSRDRNERWRTHDRDRDRDEQYTQRDDDDSRLARESMERDYYGGAEGGGRGGYRHREQEDRAPRYHRGHGQGDYDQEYGRRGMGQEMGQDMDKSGRYSESGYGRGREFLGREARHYGNRSGGWPGREEEQWRNRDTHGQYDRDANYGGFSSPRDDRGYGEGRSYQAGSHQGGRGRWGQAGTQYGGGYGGYPGQRRWLQDREQGEGDVSWRGERSRHGQGSDYGAGHPSGGRAYGGDYSGTPSGYFGEDYGRSDWQRRSQWGSQVSQSRAQWGEQQDFRGRGPRGYKRSDERIREDVCERLTDDDYLDASDIEVTVKDGEVTLSGFVSSREDKRWAETLVERVSGVKEVQNSLRVQDQRRTQSVASGQSAASSNAQSSTQGSAQDPMGTMAAQGKESNVQH